MDKSPKANTVKQIEVGALTARKIAAIKKLVPHWDKQTILLKIEGGKITRAMCYSGAGMREFYFETIDNPKQYLEVVPNQD